MGMARLGGGQEQHLVIMSLHTLMESTGPATENFSNSMASVTCRGRGSQRRGLTSVARSPT